MSKQPTATDGEVKWSAWLAEQMQGVAEYWLPCKARVDIVTDTLAIEVDWVKKWAEAFGQATYYAAQTDRQPAVLLLLRGKHTEAKYLARARITGAKSGIPVLTWKTHSEA